MKKLLIPFVLLSLNPCFAQEEEVKDTTHYPPVGSKEYYLQKSKGQIKAGRTLLIGGTALIITGIIAGSSGSNKSENLGYGPSFEAGAFFLVIGFLADIISIPCFIAGAKNAKRAALAGETTMEFKSVMEKESIAGGKKRKVIRKDLLNPLPAFETSSREGSANSLLSGY